MNLSVWLSTHGYQAIAVIAFLSAIDLPAPTSVSLLLAGAACADGDLSLLMVIVIATVAQQAGSAILYLGGRYTGWWLLTRLCGLSLNSESCIFSSAEFFYRSGSTTLLFARFVPGLNSIASPLAGSLHMRVTRFLILDGIGALVFVSTFALGGYLLSEVIETVVRRFIVFGHLLLVVLALAAIGYGVWVLIFTIRNRKYRDVARVSAAQLRARMENPDPARPIVVADVRSHGYYDPDAVRIERSIRIEPSRLPKELEALKEMLECDCDIFVYCSCMKQATSIRIAHMLSKMGARVTVIEGGMKSWIKAGYPTERVPAHDLAHLPRFD